MNNPINFEEAKRKVQLKERKTQDKVIPFSAHYQSDEKETIKGTLKESTLKKGPFKVIRDFIISKREEVYAWWDDLERQKHLYDDALVDENGKLYWVGTREDGTTFEYTKLVGPDGYEEIFIFLDEERTVVEDKNGFRYPILANGEIDLDFHKNR